MEFINRLIHALTEVHPLHPMLVHFPIALSGAGFLFILLALWRRSRSLDQAAFANIALAAFTSILAGLSGVRDNMVNYEGDAPNAEWKVILAVAFFLVSTVTALARWRNPELIDRPASRWLYVSAYGLSFALALVLAFLGGVILYGF